MMAAHDQSALVRLQEIVHDDAYAGTFQSFGQFRGALLKHIANLLSAQAALTAVKQAMEAINASQYTREDADTFAQALIAQGWHNDSLECVDGLHGLLQGFLRTHQGA